MSIRLPAGQNDLALRMGLALCEAAADRILADLARRFEDSLINAPPEDVADLLLWHHGQLEEARERVVAQCYRSLREWLREGGEPSDAIRGLLDARTIH